MTAQRRLLVTSALPYANGHIHIGHLVEYLQTDIWVRFQKLRGHECRYMCADDTHGTAIMIRAQQEGRPEEEWIAEMREAHIRDFAAFDIEFDNFGSTHSVENRELCAEIWAKLRLQNLVVERQVSQLYDPTKGLFLADRYVKGTCPKCDTPDQNGDSCDNCGSTYSPTDLKDPYSTLSGTTPQTREAKHLFITTEKFHDFLDEWTQGGKHLQSGVANYLKGHFLAEPLQDWDVSRPAPYFGFEISDSPGNYWYVWFDAPIGYIASTKQWCDRTGHDLNDYWRSADTEIHHFIGKDIVYFHTLFWPAVLKASGFSLPTRVQVHGMLTVNGEKMSKSKGTFIMASTYLEHLDAAYLRYFYATKLTSKVEDLDFDVDEFVTKVNSTLIGKVINLASRSARFVQDLGLSARYPDDGGLFERGAAQGNDIAEAYEACDYSKALRLILALADRANEYVDQMQPWALRKDPARIKEMQDVCSVALNLFRQIVIYLAPVLPRLAAQTGELLGESLDAWQKSQTPRVGARLKPFEHLMQRVDPKHVQAMAAASVSAAGGDIGGHANADAMEAHPGKPGNQVEPIAPECSIDDFTKVDLRVAKVLEAKEVEGAKKLLELTLDVGSVKRTVFAGIKSQYNPTTLIGRLVVVVANLKPRKMKFGTSEGMVIAAAPSTESGEPGIFLLSPDSGAKPGQRVG